MNKQYAIGTYEINLLDKNELKSILKVQSQYCSYIDTAIDYDNDYVLSDFQKLKMISKISSCHYDEYDFFVDNHLKYLNRDKIDIMLIHSNRGDWEPLAKKMQGDKRFDKIGVSNFTKKDIIRYNEVTGNWPYANEVEINPFYTDGETIQFCKEKGIIIIAYAVLGGKYNSWRNVATFGLGNLLSYIEEYADIVITRANSITEAMDFKDVVNNFNPKDASVIKINSNEIDKSIQPMNYRVPNIKYNKMFGMPTYMREVGNNGKVKSKKIVDIKLPEFEMLGDYKTYIRYKFGGTEYLGDWLKIDKNKYIAVYIWDKSGKLTKVSPDADRIEVVEYELSE